MFDLYQTASKTNPPRALEVALRARELEKRQALMAAQYMAETRSEQKRRLPVIGQIAMLLGLGR